MSKASVVKAELIAKQVVRKVLDAAKEVKVVGFVEAVKAIEVIETVTGKAVCVRPFYYI